MSTIRDPQTHTGARINDFGQMLVESTTKPEDRHVNREHQEVWSLPFRNITPVAADDFFFYFKNTGAATYVITDVRGATTVAGYIDICHVSGTAVHTADTDINPVNRFVGSSKTPLATIKTDTDVTGIVDEGVIFSLDVATVNQLHHLRTTAGIIVPPGQAVGLRWSEATGAMSGVVSIASLV